MCRKRTIDNKARFDQIVDLIAATFLVENDFFLKKSKHPKYVNAFRVIVCLCISGGLCGAEIARLSHRNCRGIYKARNLGYKLIDNNPEYKQKYIHARNIIYNKCI